MDNPKRHGVFNMQFNTPEKNESLRDIEDIIQDYSQENNPYLEMEILYDEKQGYQTNVIFEQFNSIRWPECITLQLGNTFGVGIRYFNIYTEIYSNPVSSEDKPKAPTMAVIERDGDEYVITKTIKQKDWVFASIVGIIIANSINFKKGRVFRVPEIEGTGEIYVHPETPAFEFSSIKPAKQPPEEEEMEEPETTPITRKPKRIETTEERARGRRLTPKGDEKTKKKLRIEACVGCRIGTRLECSCCARPYCSVECQRMEH